MMPRPRTCADIRPSGRRLPRPFGRRFPRRHGRPSPRRVGWGVLAGLLLAAGPLLAQQPGAVTGQVVNAQSLEPLVGAQVFLEDTDLGALTDSNGRYRIASVPPGQATVRVRLVGFRPEARSVTVPAGESVTADFELTVSAISMDELVVTATGVQRTRELGHAVSTLNAAEEVERAAPPTFTHLLRGRSTGVNIRESSGSVGTAPSIKIRGNTSIGLDNTPLVYVDGARIDNSNQLAGGVGGQNFTRLNDLNPEDIESIEVVKGPAAATLYGTEASAGVIRITTKQGRTDAVNYTFRTEQGANWDATDWWAVAWSPERGLGLEILTGVPAVKDTTYVLNLLEGAGPFETPFRTGHVQNYAGSMSGGLGDVQTFLSGSFRNEEGNLPSNQLERWTARGNFALRPSDRVSVNVSTGFTSSEALLPENDNNLFGIIGNALGSPWWGPLTRPDPNEGGEPVETCFLAFEVARSTGAPLAEINDIAGICNHPYFVGTNDKLFLLENGQDVERFTGSATLEWRPADIWTNRVTVGYDESSALTRNITPVDPEGTFFGDSDGLIVRSDRNATNLTLEASSTVNLELSDDLVSATTVGVQFFDDRFEITQALGRRFPAGSPSVGNSVETEGADFFSQAKTLGVFLEERIAWRDRVFVTPRVRLDDNSAFGQELGLKAYPGVNVSWLASDEAGFPDFFEQFRLRAAWGESGKQPQTNAALGLLTPTAVSFRDQDRLGVTTNQPANPELKPETGREFEFGFDASVLDGRLGVEFTFYDQKSRDVIVQNPLAPSRGFPGPVFENVSEMTNRGIELALDGLVLDRADVSWQLRSTLTTNDNEITELPEPIVFGSQRHREGFPFASYFARPVTLDADGSPVVGDEVEFLGQPTPEWEGAFSTSITLFGTVTLYGLADYAGGHQLENGLEEFSCGLFGGGGFFGSCPEIFELGPDGEPTDEALIKDRAAAAGTPAPFIYDADYMKLRTVSATVALPGRLARSFGARGVDLTLSANNLATWTSYEGTDPEVNFAGGAQATRAQLWTLPPARTFVGRLSVTF